MFIYVHTSSVVDDDDHSTTCCRHELIRRFAHSHFIYTQQFNNNTTTTSDILATGLEEINSRIYVVPNVWAAATSDHQPTLTDKRVQINTNL